MKYLNPIVLADYSDPDLIRVGDDFYMVSSSFHFNPGIPILHSKDLVHWELVNYVVDKLIPGFEKVRPGHGIWAPSIREHNGSYYCLVPYPDEGIYVYKSDDILGKWKLHSQLLVGPGYEDPCPVWIGNKAYVVFAFVKSRIGFHNKLAIIEVDEDLKVKITNDYQVIFDGDEYGVVDIEGPKFYLEGEYIHILAPQGGVKYGNQLDLRSKDIYGPYEMKVVLDQNDSDINGPHQGGLVPIHDNHYAFIHFQDKDNVGRILRLEPVELINHWFIMGDATTPVVEGEISLKEEILSIDYEDNFKGKINKIWQTPCVLNDIDSWIKVSDIGLEMNVMKRKEDAIFLEPYVLTQKVSGFHLKYEVEIDVSGLEEGEMAGLGIIGENSSLVMVKKEEDKCYLYAVSDYEGNFIERKGQLVPRKTKLTIEWHNPEEARVYIDEDSIISHVVTKEKWVGLRVGLFALCENEPKGKVIFSNFTIKTA